MALPRLDPVKEQARPSHEYEKEVARFVEGRGNKLEVAVPASELALASMLPGVFKSGVVPISGLSDRGRASAPAIASVRITSDQPRSDLLFTATDATES